MLSQVICLEPTVKTGNNPAPRFLRHDATGRCTLVRNSTHNRLGLCASEEETLKIWVRRNAIPDFGPATSANNNRLFTQVQVGLGLSGLFLKFPTWSQHQGFLDSVNTVAADKRDRYNNHHLLDSGKAIAFSLVHSKVSFEIDSIVNAFV